MIPDHAIRRIDLIEAEKGSDLVAASVSTVLAVFARKSWETFAGRW